MMNRIASISSPINNVTISIIYENIGDHIITLNMVSKQLLFMSRDAVKSCSRNTQIFLTPFPLTFHRHHNNFHVWLESILAEWISCQNVWVIFLDMSPQCFKIMHRFKRLPETLLSETDVIPFGNFLWSLMLIPT